ncbi:unnamed protein product [Alopecurus aequalis]
MASGDQMKKLVGMMLAAIVLVAAADANPEQEAGTCIGSASDVPGAASPCICSNNCACAGKCILNAVDGDNVKTCFVECACAGKCILNAVDGDNVKTCFVECVLKNDCVHGPGPLPAILDKPLRLNVTRPRVSRSSKDPEELLVIGVAVEPHGTGEAVFDVYVNVPEGVKIDSKDSPNYVWTFKATPDKVSHRVVRRREIGGVLRTIGAGRDETIVVSLLPRAWGNRITIVSVKIE